MAYIESHQTLSRNKKLLRLVRLLGADKHKLIGHLHELWWWALDHVPADGDLSDLEPDEVAYAAEWDGDPEQFYRALVQAGFIDEGPEGRRLHDWYNYAGRLYEAKAAAEEAGRLGSHRRWHQARGIKDPSCPYCQAEVGEPTAHQIDPPIGTLKGGPHRPYIGSDSTKPNQDKANQTTTPLPPPPPEDTDDEQPAAGKPSGRDLNAEVEEFHAYYCQVWSDVFPRGPKLTRDRRQKIKSRLQTFSLDDLKRACDALHSSAYHRGDNQDGKAYGTIDLLVRSDSQVDKWLTEAEARPAKAGPREPPDQKSEAPVGAPNAGAYQPVSAQAVAAFRQLYPDEYG